MPNLDVLLEVLRVPDRVTVFCEDGEREMSRASEPEWTAQDVMVTTRPDARGTLPILLSALHSAVKQVRLRWSLPEHGAKRVLRRRLGARLRRFGMAGRRPGAASAVVFPCH